MRLRNIPMKRPVSHSDSEVRRSPIQPDLSTPVPQMKHAIVIKGPLQSPTAQVIRWYLEHEDDSTGVVFSHNSACLSDKAQATLRGIFAMHPSRFHYIFTT